MYCTTRVGAACGGAFLGSCVDSVVGTLHRGVFMSWDRGKSCKCVCVCVYEREREKERWDSDSVVVHARLLRYIRAGHMCRSYVQVICAGHMCRSYVQVIHTCRLDRCRQKGGEIKTDSPMAFQRDKRRSNEYVLSCQDTHVRSSECALCVYMYTYLCELCVYVHECMSLYVRAFICMLCTAQISTHSEYHSVCLCVCLCVRACVYIDTYPCLDRNINMCKSAYNAQTDARIHDNTYIHTYAHSYEHMKTYMLYLLLDFETVHRRPHALSRSKHYVYGAVLGRSLGGAPVTVRVCEHLE